MLCEITCKVYQNCTLTRLLSYEFSDYFFCRLPRGCIPMICMYYHKNLNVNRSRFFFGLKSIEKWIKRLYSNERAMKDTHFSFSFNGKYGSSYQYSTISCCVIIFFLSGFSFTIIYKSQDCRGRREHFFIFSLSLPPASQALRY